MASFKNYTHNTKASSLQGGAVLSNDAPATGSGKAKKTSEGTLYKPRREGRRFFWVVDFLILVLTVACICGAWFGYRHLRNKWAPAWDVRQITFCILIEDMDPALLPYDQNGELALHGKTVWSSDRASADAIGKITSYDTVMIAQEGKANTVDLYLYVEADALYRAGEGYRVERTPLLAGQTGVYRFAGLIAEGSITSLDDTSDTTREK